MLIILVASLCLVAIIALVVARSLRVIGPAEIGLVNKRFARRSLADGNPVATNGEAGYQAELLMPGLRFKLWPINSVSKHPWVQVPAGELGVVIAQVGDPIAIGAKSAEYREAVLPPELPKLAIEAGVTGGWWKYVHGGQTPGAVLGIDSFGESAPAGVLMKHFGFTVENVVAKAKTLV